LSAAEVTGAARPTNMNRTPTTKAGLPSLEAQASRSNCGTARRREGSKTTSKTVNITVR